MVAIRSQNDAGIRTLVPAVAVVIAIFGYLTVSHASFAPGTSSLWATKSVVDKNQTANLLRRDGYQSERLQVRTSDGYLLTVYRISPPVKPKGVILFHHGIRESSDVWMFLGPKKSLAYQLYETGYDIWFSNSRASPESDGHETLDQQDSYYWDFSFHEIGIFDLPAVIDYILQATESKRLHLIGYSEAGSATLVMLSELPEYNAKLSSVNLMAPPAIMTYNQFSLIAKLLQPFLSIFPWNAHFARNSLPSDICTLFKKDCCLLFGQMGDHGNGGSCFDLQDVSLKQLEHYRQIIAIGRFRQFDYGYRENLNRYHRNPPPDYCLWRVTAKVSLHYGNRDTTVNWQGVEMLAKRLVHSKVVEKFLYKDFNHRDFYRSNKTQSYLYPNVIKFIKRATPK